MVENYELGVKIKFNGAIYQTLINNEKKVGFVKIVNDKYIIPTALEILKLNSLINPNNVFKFS